MKDGYITTKAAGEITDEELAGIHAHSRRQMKKDELYVFSVILCDNEIDRDNERFSTEALHTLAKLFIGKTGIFDHEMRCDNQTARIFETEVETLPDQKTKFCEPYSRLRAKAYMPRTPQNEGLILEIDAGIKKEVSVGCAVGSVNCSVCGADIRKKGCEHVKGREYGNQTAHHILSDPTDAYEWSFVAVPAQLGAGVIKAFHVAETDDADTLRNLQGIVKYLKTARGDLILKKEEAALLSVHIDDLDHLSACGKAYREDLRAEMLRLCAAEPDFDLTLFSEVSRRMTLAEIKSMRDSFARRQQKGGRPQLASLPEKPTGSGQHQGFLI